MASEAAAMPDRVGRYEIILPIAKGGMATVYLARASGVGGFDRYMALKLTASHLRADPDFAAHLIEEAKLVAHLRHTNVVPVYDVGECEHGVFLVMEYVPGDSFAGIRAQSRKQNGVELSIRVQLRILVDALHGLHAAHEQTDEDGNPLELVHRDFSPQNILVGTDGIGRLTDFGISKATSRVSNTGKGLIKGKLRYVAPEQVRGEPLDRRCDVWAAGVIAWETLTGQRLINVEDTGALVAKEDPPRVKSLKPDISDALDDLVASALRFDREKRLRTAQLFARALAGSAKSMGLLADADEVADVVNRLAGPELTQRKQRLAEARKARRISAPDVRELAESGRATPVHMRPALPSLPEIPITPLSVTVPTSPGSDLGIQVDLGASDMGDRASDRLLGGESSSVSPTPDAPESAPEVYRSPVALPDESPARRTAGALEARARQARRVLEPFFKPPWTRKKIITLASAGGGALLFLVLVIALASGGSDADTTKQATRTVGSASASPVGRAATVVPGAGGGLAASPELPEETAPTLQIKANGPIARVGISGRSIDAVVPSPMLGVELLDEEEGKTLQIVVTSTDGRVAVANAEPGTRDVEVTFGDKRRPTPKPKGR